MACGRGYGIDVTLSDTSCLQEIENIFAREVTIGVGNLIDCGGL